MKRDQVLNALFNLPEEDLGRSVEHLKSLTVAGYCRSKVGMHEELDYDGNKHLVRFEGCKHPEHKNWTPAARNTTGVEKSRGLMQVIRSRKVHDVVIIGIGASGGMTAFNLTQKAIKVLMLDAGSKFNRRDYWTHRVR